MTSRLDGPLKVTGQAKYGADNNFPGMVYGYVVLSTIAHGEIEDMDVTAAKSAPGVLGVYTPFDPLELRKPSSPVFGETWVPLQDREVTYYGQPIGFVVAGTFEQARDAALLIEVTYHARPALTSLPDGLASAEPAPSNEDITVLADDVESIEDALGASPVVVEATYRTATQNHAAMEPHSAVAVWDAMRPDRLQREPGLRSAGGRTGRCAGPGGFVGPRAEPLRGRGFRRQGPHLRTGIPGGRRGQGPRSAGQGRAHQGAGLHRDGYPRRDGAEDFLGADAAGTLIALRHDSWCSTPADRSFVEPTSHGTSREWYATQNLSISQQIVPLNIPPTTYMRAPGRHPGPSRWRARSTNWRSR